MNARIQPPPAGPVLSTLLLNFRHLRAFLAVAQCGSVTAAAGQVHRVKSAVARSIHELEAGLGVPLCERSGRGMGCNAFGEALLLRAGRALTELNVGLSGLVVHHGASVGMPELYLPRELFNELRLESFVWLVACGHMSSVARQLGVSQPAISQVIGSLERALAQPLFKRGARGMQATEPAQALYFRVKRALYEMRQVGPDIAALQGVTRGQIIIGALPLGRTAILPGAIVQLLAGHPALRVATVEGPHEMRLSKLRAGGIDFIFGALRPEADAPDLAREPLLDDRLAVVARAAHPATRMSALTLAKLRDMRWVLPNSGSVGRQQLELCFRRAALEPPMAAVETSDLALLRAVLLSSDHVALISPSQVAYELQAGLLVALAVELADTARVIGIARRADSPASPAARALMAAIRDVITTPARPQRRASA